MRTGAKYMPIGRADAPVRLLIFHYAGGSALSLAPLAQAMPASCASYLVELPGRGLREHEDFAPDFAVALADLTPVVAGLVDRPAVLFGHSLGGLVAHGILGRLPLGQQALVTDLVLSAARPPAALASQGGCPVQRSRGDVLRMLLDFGGCPPALFEDTELLGRAVHLLDRDLRLIDTYQPGPRPAATVTTHIWRGMDDRQLTAADMRSWRQDVGGEVREQEFRGGHFFPSQDGAVAEGLRDLVLGASAGRRAGCARAESMP